MSETQCGPNTSGPEAHRLLETTSCASSATSESRNERRFKDPMAPVPPPQPATNQSTSQMDPLPQSVFTLPQTAQLEALYTIIRSKETRRGDFLFYSDRIIRLLVEEGLNHLPVVKKVVETPTGATYEGVGFEGRICGVSILRAGEAMEAGLREVCRSVRIGKILIQRDEETALPKLFYSKVRLPARHRVALCAPARPHAWHVVPIGIDALLMHPSATGGSAMKAVEVLMENGVPEERIIFINLISAPEGLRNFCGKYPQVKVITGWIDEGLNEKAYIIPGLGDFGERRCVLRFL
ncbi:Uracil phosphoribosyltransferase [Mycena chlorophos]|uniref:Uracil phosphoribosyltransferase n=1 Tax=Mycena chlorophos TaxID=658473 RepID=A0A8H6WCH2_MYCCL|nr:Uracil phosphoribosyltransferase [Mycena chlorophos]